MQKILACYLSLIVIALFFTSCSDDPASPEDGPIKSDSSTFEIVSIDEDTVYLNERVTVTFKGAPSSDLSGYIHTNPITIDSVWRDTAGSGSMRFRVPQTAASGSLRIYASDSVLAKSAPLMFVLPKDSSIMNPEVWSHNLEHYPGDILIIPGRDIPLRRKDMSVSLAGIQLPILAWDSSLIFARIVPWAISGPLRVTLFDKVFDLPSPTILEYGGELLPTKSVSNVQMVVGDVVANTFVTYVQGKDTTSLEQPQTILSGSLSLTSVSNHSSADSLILLADEEVNGEHRILEVRLKLEAENRVSGSIRLSYIASDNTSETIMRVKNIRWKLEDGRYILYAFSSDVSEQLESANETLYYQSLDLTVHQHSSYISSKANSAVFIAFTP